MTKKQLGELSEAKVLTRLVELGREIAIPFGDSLRYDLVMLKDGVASRIQCKTGFGDGSSLHFKTCSQNPFTDKVRGYLNEADYFAVYYPLTDRVYMVPISITTPKHQCCLRFNPTKNGQTKKVLWAKDFEV